MDHYHLLIFITSEQEKAIRNLFSQNRWKFCWKAVPPGFRDDLTVLWEKKLGETMNLYSNKKITSIHEQDTLSDAGNVNLHVKGKRDEVVLEMLDGYLNENSADNANDQENSVCPESITNDTQDDSDVAECEVEKETINDYSPKCKTGGDFKYEAKINMAHSHGKTCQVVTGYTEQTGIGKETSDLISDKKVTVSNENTDSLRNRHRIKNAQKGEAGTDSQPIHKDSVSIKDTDIHIQKDIGSHGKLIKTGNGVTNQNTKHKRSKLSQRKQRHKKKERSLGLTEGSVNSKQADVVKDNTESIDLNENSSCNKRRKKAAHSSNDTEGTASATGSADIYKVEQDTVNEKLLPNKVKNEELTTCSDGQCDPVHKQDDKTNENSEKANTHNKRHCKSAMKENIVRDPEHNKRLCGKCGKELIRKKICYDCELTCKYCGKSYANYKTRGRRCLLKTHMKSHEGDKPHICEICGKGFSHIDYMKRHAKLVHIDTENVIYVCPLCTKPFKNNHTLQIHIRSIHSSKNETYQCDTCGTIFKRKGSLAAHFRRVHVDTKNFKCDECGLMVKTADSLRAHKRTAHTPRVRTVCYICGAMLLTQDKLKKHIMRHKNSRTFQCTTCDKKFYTSHEVKQHYRTHTGEKPFKCHLCSYACAVKGNLTKHMRKHRNGDTIPKHNYIGSDYNIDFRETGTEFVKLDNASVDDDFVKLNNATVDDDDESQNRLEIHVFKQDQEEIKVYQQL